MFGSKQRPPKNVKQTLKILFLAPGNLLILTLYKVMFHLIFNIRYKFRIKVENAYGISDPSEESDAFDVGGVQLQQDSRYGPILL